MADNGEYDRPMVSILDGTNYRQWSIEMRHLLHAKGVFYYANGDDQLEENATPKERKKFRDGDGRALGLIVGHIHRPLHEAVSDINTSAELWRHLRDIHQPRTRDHLQSKFARFWDLRMQPGQPMASWTAAFANAAAELKAEQFPIDDRTMCFQVTRFLPPEYEPILRVISDLPDNEYTYQNITTKLIAEESRLGQKAADANGGPNFNFNGQVPMRGKKQPRGRGQRGRGKQRGATHNTTLKQPVFDQNTYYGEAEDDDEEEEEAEANWNQQIAKSSKQNPVICRRCGEKGHFSTKCMAPQPRPLPRQSLIKGNPTQARSHSTIDDDVEELLNSVHMLHTNEFNDFANVLGAKQEEPIVRMIGTPSADDNADEMILPDWTHCLLTHGPGETLESANISLDDEAVFTIDTTNIWLMDSGASSHFCNNRELFHEFKSCHTMAKTTGRSGKLQILGHGTIDLRIGNEVIKFANTCYAPDARVNLISEGRIDLAGLSQVKMGGIHKVITVDRKLLFEAHLIHNLYLVTVKNNASLGKTAILEAAGPMHTEESHATMPPLCETIAQEVEETLQTDEPKATPTTGDYQLWHRRMGHIHEVLVRHLARQKIVKGLPDKFVSKDDSPCTGCRLGKATKANFGPIAGIKSTKVLELLHMDVWGPTKHQTFQGHQYFLSIIDDFTRKVEVFLMRRKGEVFSIVKQYIARSEREQDTQVINIRTDNGMEFCHKEFGNYCNSLGILHQRTNFYTPEQNGVAERFNRTIMEQSKTMNNSAGLPKSFWGEAIKTATYIRNRVSSHHNKDTTAMELWNRRKPSVAYWRIYGSLAYVYEPHVKRDKHDNSAKRGIMLGYATETLGYRIMLLDSQQIVESKSVTFDETKFPGRREPNLKIRKGPTPAPRKLSYNFTSDSDDDDQFVDTDSSNDDDDDDVSSNLQMSTDFVDLRTTPVEDVNQVCDSPITLPEVRGHHLTDQLDNEQMQQERELMDEHYKATAKALMMLTSTPPPAHSTNAIDLPMTTSPTKSDRGCDLQNKTIIQSLAEIELDQLIDEGHEPVPPRTKSNKTPIRKPKVPDPKYLAEATVKGKDGKEVKILYDFNDYESDEEPVKAIIEDSENDTSDDDSNGQGVHFTRKEITTSGNPQIYYQAEDSEEKLFNYEDLCNYCTRNGIRFPLRREVNFNRTVQSTRSHENDA